MINPTFVWSILKTHRFKMYRIGWLFLCAIHSACHTPTSPIELCEDQFETLSFSALQDSVQAGIHLFKKELYLPAYVVSSDHAGQFFGKIVLQEFPNAAKGLGLLLETDMTGTHFWYKEGQKVYVKLNGLYVDQKTLGLSIGSVFPSFGNLSIGRLPALSTQSHLAVSCDPFESIVPNQILIPELTELNLQTLVQIDSVKLELAAQGENFASYQEDSLRTFYDPQGNKIVLNSSGYSDFWNQLIPTDWVKIKGILTKKRSQYQIEIRDEKDIQSY